MVDISHYRKRKVKTASSRYGMVSTASRAATEAGVEMLARGGNAVDAAVAAAFCLGVTEPQASGLGGQSIALLYLAGRDNGAVAVDGSSRAPFGLSPSGVPSKPFKVGIRATTVPSTPAVLGYLLDTYGSMPLGVVLGPAVAAAERGYKLTALQHSLLTQESAKLQEDELARSIFFRNGYPLNAGEVIRQPQLASCLQRMAEKGWEDFYLGEIGEFILKDMQERNGFITRMDLSRIPVPIERPVLNATYRGLNLITFPPPGAGRALAQILNILEYFTAEELAPETACGAVILAMAFRAALRNREKYPVDPSLYPQSPDRWMLDKELAAEIAQRIRKLASYHAGSYAPPRVAGETTHLSVADAYGNMVGITQSIELVFGSKTMARGPGFFYNNYMSAFDYKDILHPYYLLPGARPWSSVAPSLVFEKGRPRLLLGSPGSERISTTLAQVITRFFDAGQDLAAAVEAPRLHAGSSGRILIEKKRFAPEVLEALSKVGFEVSRRGPYSFYLGCVQAVQLPDSPGGLFYGVSDPRRDGSARGPDGE